MCANEFAVKWQNNVGDGRRFAFRRAKETAEEIKYLFALLVSHFVAVARTKRYKTFPMYPGMCTQRAHIHNAANTLSTQPVAALATHTRHQY